MCQRKQHVRPLRGLVVARIHLWTRLRDFFAAHRQYLSISVEPCYVVRISLEAVSRCIDQYINIDRLTSSSHWTEAVRGHKITCAGKQDQRAWNDANRHPHIVICWRNCWISSLVDTHLEGRLDKTMNDVDVRQCGCDRVTGRHRLNTRRTRKTNVEKVCSCYGTCF